MPKVSQIEQRKSDHIRINLEEDISSSYTTGLAKYHFNHEALPELDLKEIDTNQTIFGKTLTAPILISAITGGTQESSEINRRLAEAAQETGVAMSLGSQRAALEQTEKISTFSIARKVAPEISLFANLGAVQLNYGYGPDECQRVVDMVNADALVLHLNPLQEALQQEQGNTNFSNLCRKLEAICESLSVPVIVKEVGWGISKRTAELLADCGVDVIDVAGAGGTSWSQVEMHRALNELERQLAASFRDWGVNTVASIMNVREVAPKMTIFASGGLKNGVDIAKCIALGATLGGFAGKFLQAAAISTEKVIELIVLTRRQIEVTMFAAAAKDIESLKQLQLIKRE